MFSCIPGSSLSTLATLHIPSPVAHIRPLKVHKKKEDVKDDQLQQSLDSSQESSSNDNDESYEVIDSSQEIHLTGDGTKILIFS